jgi:hypothetical protein
MNRIASRSRWIPLAVTAVLCSFVALVMPNAAGAADPPAYTLNISGTCPSINELSIYTLVIKNNSAATIEVSALGSTLSVPAGGLDYIEFPEAALGNGLQDSIRVDGATPAEIPVSIPSCLSPPSKYTVEYTPACSGDTGPGSVTVTNTVTNEGTRDVVVTVAGSTFVVGAGATVTKDAPSGLSAGDFAINGDPVVGGAFTVGNADCAEVPPSSTAPSSSNDAPSSADDAPSSSNDAPSSSDDAPSSTDNAPASVEDGVPIAAPLPVAFTG